MVDFFINRTFFFHSKTKIGASNNRPGPRAIRWRYLRLSAGETESEYKLYSERRKTSAKGDLVLQWKGTVGW